MPDGPSAVQLDHDGTPMVTDVMHDVTCEKLAGVLAHKMSYFYWSAAPVLLVAYNKYYPV